MQEFQSADARHDFSLDGARYFIPAVKAEHIKIINASAELPLAEQGDAMRDFLAGAARSHRAPLLRFLTGQRSPRRAVAALSLEQVVALFKGWAGMGKETPLGESSGSAAEQ